MYSHKIKAVDPLYFLRIVRKFLIVENVCYIVHYKLFVDNSPPNGFVHTFQMYRRSSDSADFRANGNYINELFLKTRTKSVKL